MVELFSILVFVGSFFVLLGFYFYKPAPEGIEDKWTYTIHLTIDKFLCTLGDALHWLGIRDKRLFWQDYGQLRRTLNGAKPETNHPDVQVSKTKLNGVEVLIYMPRHQTGCDGRPALVYIHGGGHYLGTALSAQPFLLPLVQQTRVVAISVEYRLAPQHPFPSGLDDCETVARYVFEYAEELGVDRQRVGIGGDSAGGNMAAALSQKFRDMGNNPQFQYQLLIYPRVQGIHQFLPSFMANTQYSAGINSKEGVAIISLTYNGFPLENTEIVANGEHISMRTRKRFEHYVDHKNLPIEYIPDTYKPHKFKTVETVDEKLEKFYLNPYIWPLMADSLKGLPPAIVTTMGYDTLRDDGLLYLKRLQDDGVEAEHYHDEQGFHGALNSPLKPGPRLISALIQYVKTQL